MLDAFSADELASESLHVFGLTTKDDDFEAGFVIQVGMQSGNAQFVMIVLKVGKPFGQETGVVIANQSDGADDKSIVGNNDRLNELVAD